jgi:hypothetical protein
LTQLGKLSAYLRFYLVGKNGLVACVGQGDTCVALCETCVTAFARSGDPISQWGDAVGKVHPTSEASADRPHFDSYFCAVLVLIDYRQLFAAGNTCLEPLGII